MKTENLKIIISTLICVIGALLIGFNAGKLSNIINIILFSLGILLLSASTIIFGFFEKIFKKKDKE